MKRAVSVLGLLLALGGCYSFTGGGLPRHVRTIAVGAFENATPQPLLESDLEARLQDELPRNLGVRLAAETTADAVIRGRIIEYAVVPASFRPTQGNDDAVAVVQQQVRITYEAEIYDMREDRSLWRAQGQSVTGNFQPDSETVDDGRARAIQEIVRRVIEGAQSQW